MCAILENFVALLLCSFMYKKPDLMCISWTIECSFKVVLVVSDRLSTQNCIFGYLESFVLS